MEHATTIAMTTNWTMMKRKKNVLLKMKEKSVKLTIAIQMKKKNLKKREVYLKIIFLRIIWKRKKVNRNLNWI